MLLKLRVWILPSKCFDFVFRCGGQLGLQKMSFFHGYSVSLKHLSGYQQCIVWRLPRQVELELYFTVLRCIILHFL